LTMLPRISMALQMRAEHGQSDIKHIETWRQLDQELRPAQESARKALSEAVGQELRSRAGQGLRE
jgi:hypothetical protein